MKKYFVFGRLSTEKIVKRLFITLIIPYIFWVGATLINLSWRILPDTVTMSQIDVIHNRVNSIIINTSYYGKKILMLYQFKLMCEIVYKVLKATEIIIENHK